ncbi:MAG TPA: RHS repeat-associated core domain-containing protein [Pseudomonas sp.]|uniref:RHS repeat domain-containing protein n=1 Tax=Pseudomonas sp. TaxID=306 RepID=UPI002B49B95B|nr:RHS repeat-associated core domain-containing protein [Pseudomonas sp.]HKS11417.1 RHS repeat-associated core domain-containing protein [Pseudomonas sp.]
MSLHSNAFNFMGFVHGSVDQRTGQFSAAIDLPWLKPNDLCGPELPLQLGFNPMNEQNSGFGIGWTLKLTQFVIPSGMLALHTGESFKVSDNGPGEAAVIPEQKLESFRFSNISEDDIQRFRIAHKAGLTEILEPQGPLRSVALPVRILAPSGHGITLAYTTVNSEPRLASIIDDTQRTLLSIDYSSNAQVVVDIDQGTDVHKRFTLSLQNGELTEVVLPTEEAATWRFSYSTFGNLHYMNRVENPIGGVETVAYNEHGHSFPGVSRTLPYAIEHVLQPDPLDETTHLKTTYAYSQNNFLGNGTGISWIDDGQDNLYKFTGTGYSYGSTASHYLDGQVLRTVTCSYNRFHLLTERVTRQQGCLETITSHYHEQPNTPFKDQPNHFQLPHKITKTWTLADNSKDRRDETLETLYDASGNLIEEIQANGMRMVREYYPQEASEGCPADPEGFVRNLKSVTEYPAPGEGAAQVKRTRYRYEQQSSLTQATRKALPDAWLAIKQEDTFEVALEAVPGREAETLLRQSVHTYLKTPDNPRLHGRPEKQELSINGHTSTTRWHYELIKDTAGQPTWLQTRQTFNASCGTVEASLVTVHSIHSAQLVQEQDFNGIVTRYRHDVLNRIIEQTTSPDDPTYKASRTFAYPLIKENGRTRSCEEVTDVKGVLTRIVYDGHNRPLREEQEDTLKRRKVISESRYDTVGRLVGETFYDYPADAPDTLAHQQPDVTMTYTYAYDGWGNRSETTGPDQVKHLIETSPFGEGGDIVTRWTVSPDKPTLRQNVRISQLNAFNKARYEYRQLEQSGDSPDSAGKDPVQLDRTNYVYDGLGRCIKETVSLGQATPQAQSRVSEYVYDIWGRMTETVRPDRSTLKRTFAPHSLNELTTLLQVRPRGSDSDRTVCKRTFDGLDRLLKVTVGPRIDEYRYHAGTQLVDKRISYTLGEGRKNSSRRVFAYKYQPQLSQQPTQLTASIEDTAGVSGALEAAFTYDPDSAAIASADNSNGARTYRYTDQGHLAGETWKVGGEERYSTEYRHSLQGRMRYRKHSDSALACEYAYDGQGRVTDIIQGALHSRLDYDSEGLLCSTRTTDSANNDRYVLCRQTYDAFGREIQRTLSANGDEEQVLTLTWLDNDMLHTRTLVRAGREVRKETFAYDELDRLVEHDCQGEALPRNAKGRAISNQLYRFDELDNLTRCQTRFADGTTDRADFTYAADGSFQLQKVTHRLLEDYPAEQTFSYDDHGNMLNDEQGRELEYDSLGRLRRVIEVDGEVTVEYLYDGHDQLVGSVHGGSRQVERRYLGHRLDSTLDNDVLTQYLYGGGRPLGSQRADDASATHLLLTDPSGSVIGECDNDGVRHADYSAYGERPDDNGMRNLLAFNGEAREEALGWYLLGSGYRAYNPALMRFHSPDSLSPEAAGLNPYVYALGNPVNWRDPTGHRSQAIYDRDPPELIDPPEKPKTHWAAWISVGISVVMFAISAVTMPWTAPATIGLTGAYVKGVLGVTLLGASAVTSAAAVVVGQDDYKLSNTLASISGALSFLGGLSAFSGIAATKAAVTAARAASGSTATISKLGEAVARLSTRLELIGAEKPKLAVSTGTAMTPQPSPSLSVRMPTPTPSPTTPTFSGKGSGNTAGTAFRQPVNTEPANAGVTAPGTAKRTASGAPPARTSDDEWQTGIPDHAQSNMEQVVQYHPTEQKWRLVRFS